MKQLLLLLTLCLIAPVVSAQVNEMRLSWNTVASADTYKVYTGTSTRAYTSNANVGAGTQTVLNLPTADIEWFVALKAVNALGESIGFSREVHGFPRAEVTAIDSSCIPNATGVTCTASITGFNFAPAAVADITYPGVVVNSSTRFNPNSMVIVFDIASSAAGGSADLIITQPWTITPGTAIPGDDASTGGSTLIIAADIITITPIILPSDVNNLIME